MFDIVLLPFTPLRFQAELFNKDLQ